MREIAIHIAMGEAVLTSVGLVSLAGRWYVDGGKQARGPVVTAFIAWVVLNLLIMFAAAGVMR